VAQGRKRKRQAEDPGDTPAAADGPPAEERPLAPLVAAVGLALAAATLVLRTFSSGAGFELHQPGAQLLADALALTAAAAWGLARHLRGQAILGGGRGRVAAWLAFAAVVALAAGRAPQADLAWRTALTWTSLLALGLTAGDVARDRALRPHVVGLVVACVATGALLACYQDLVEHPALRAEYQAGGLDADLAHLDPAFRQGLLERLMAEGAVGPYLLANLLACAVAMVAPLAGALAWTHARARRWLPAAASGAAFAALLLALGLSRSKGGLLAAAAAGAVFVALHPRLAGWRRTLLGAALVSGLFGAAVGAIAYVRSPDEEGVGLSLAVRLEYWQAGLRMWRESPLLGVGLNAFRDYYGALKPPQAEEVLHAHNAPVQLLAETGLVGLLAFLALAVAWVRPAWQALTPSPPPPAPTPEPPAPSAEPEPGSEPPAPGPPAPSAEPEPGSEPPAPGPPAPSPEPPPPGSRSSPPLTPSAAWLAVGGGVALGAFLLLGFGDYVSGDTPGKAGLVLALVPALAYACAPRGEGLGPLLAPAGLAGAAAFGADALTDFGLHHAGVLAVAAWVLALAPARRPATAPLQPPALRLGVLGLLAALALGVTLLLVPRAVEADLLRQAGKRRHGAGATAAQAGEAARARELLAEACALYEDAVAGYPWDAGTWRDLGAAERSRGRPAAAVGALEEAVRRSPRSSAAWSELGQARAEAGDAAGALEALDRAVALYPTHPERLLAAARLRVELRAAGHDDPAALAAAAARLLDRAEAASAATRLVLRKLRPEQEAEVARLRERLARPPPGRDGLGGDGPG